MGTNVVIMELLAKKSTYLKEFLRLTVGQKQALSEKNTERFNELVEAKQAVIEQVNLLDAELGFDKKTSRHPGEDNTVSFTDDEYPDRGKISELEQGILQYLQQLRILDNEINELMKQNLSETIKTINELQVARRTQTAYRSNSRPANSYFINKKR